jgi:hypothetical protein
MNTLATYVGKTNKALRTEGCNIRVQPLQHMQHPNLLCNIRTKHLQHTSEISKTLNIHLQHAFFTLSFFFRQRRAERGMTGSGQLAVKDGGTV